MVTLSERPKVEDTPPPRSSAGRPGFGLGLALRYLFLAVVIAIGIYGSIAAVAVDNFWALAVVVVMTVALVAAYVTGRFVPLKYLIPGILLLLMFQLYPVLYTFYTAFTNSGDGHRVSKQESIQGITVGGPVVESPDSPRFALSVAVAEGSDPAVAPFVYFLVGPDGDVRRGDEAGLTDVEAASVTVTSGRVSAAEGYTLLDGNQVNSRNAELDEFQVPAGDNQAVQKVGLSQAFLGRTVYVYDDARDTITDTGTGTVYVPDVGTGNWVPESGDGPRLSQGWQVFVGADNFTRVLTDDTIRNSFVAILIWNIAFAFLSVLTTFVLGLLLAVALDSPRLRGQRITRSLLLLPYALPAFITALVWGSMFNRDFGLINNLTGLGVDWLGNAWWAKFAILVVNLWLGFPYMFIVCTGALQSIPGDLKEAATVDGASPFTAFRTVVLPMLMVAVAPLLVASFAFNFNNFVLIQLLTEGGPFSAENPTAGQTDLLISYTYRLAFGGSGAQFGFAAAVSVFIFFIVAVISISSFRKTQALEDLA
ncbi:MAG: ABC transporter permease subunit [Geodermatophilaceae bacterium]|nr:ABC transporter permease subunit [Geodermatophilaceae bacterium]